MEKKHKIRQLRQHLKLTQQELADTLGISRSSYANVEIGVNALGAEHIETLFIKYGFNPMWYFANIGPMIIDTQDMIQFFTSKGHINVIQDNSNAFTKINSPVNQTVNSFVGENDKNRESMPPQSLELEIMKTKLDAANDKMAIYEAHIKSLQEMVEILKSK